MINDRADISKAEHIELLEYLLSKQKTIDECHELFNDMDYPVNSLQERIKRLISQNKILLDKIHGLRKEREFLINKTLKNSECNEE